MVFAPFRDEDGYRFIHFCLESSMVFEGNTGVYESICRFNSKWIRKKESYANSKWILRNLFVDVLIWVHVMLIKRGEVWKRVWKMTVFWSGIGSGFGEPSGTPPPRIPRSKPRVTPGLVNPAHKKLLNVSGLLTYPSLKPTFYPMPSEK